MREVPKPMWGLSTLAFTLLFLGGTTFAETGAVEPEIATLVAECRSGNDLYSEQSQPDPQFLLEQHDRVLQACNRLIDSKQLQDMTLVQALLDRADLLAPGNETHGQAISDYDRAIALMPNMADAYWRRAKSNLLYARDLSMALRDVDKAISLDTTYPEFYVTRSSIYAWSDRPNDAMADLETALRLDPRSVHALTNRALAYFNKLEISKALKDFDAAILLAPKDPSLYTLRSAARLRAGDQAGSKEDAETAERLEFSSQ